MKSQVSARHHVRVPIDSLEADFPIDGLRFESNLVLEGDHSRSHRKLLSSYGPLVSDYVTHGMEFSYSTYGIHLGQDDRLTFLGGTGAPIVGHFVDCRVGSKTLHEAASIEYETSFNRKLIIPRGIAHTFDNLEGVLTRDEPIWYVDEQNTDWNIDNDLISVARTVPAEAFPAVRPNRLLLPDDGHVFFSRLSQEALKKPKSYLSRYKANIAGVETYVMVEMSNWTDRDSDIDVIVRMISPGINLAKNRYAYTGPESFTVVPNTESCLSDIIELEGKLFPDLIFHKFSKKIYTFFGDSRGYLLIEFIDEYGAVRSESINCDPRINVSVDPGVAYNIKIDSGSILVRVEHEVFISCDTIEKDILRFGSDTWSLDECVGITPAELPQKAPASIVRFIARVEASRFETEGASRD